MLTKKDFAELLEAGQVTLSHESTGYSKTYRASYNRYAILLETAGGKRKLTHEEAEWLRQVPYYSTRTKTLAMTVWGMSQEFEAQATLADIAMYEKLGRYSNEYFYNIVKNISVYYDGVKAENPLKSLKMLAKLGEILGKDQKQKNQLKTKALQAGMGEGLDLPEDWDNLPEAEKEERLNKAIAVL